METGFFQARSVATRDEPNGMLPKANPSVWLPEEKYFPFSHPVVLAATTTICGVLFCGTSPAGQEQRYFGRSPPRPVDPRYLTTMAPGLTNRNSRKPQSCRKQPGIRSTVGDLHGITRVHPATGVFQGVNGAFSKASQKTSHVQLKGCNIVGDADQLS